MTRTVTAFFDCREHAEAACRQLRAQGVKTDSFHVVDRSAPGAGMNSTVAGGEHQGLFDTMVRMFIPQEDVSAYRHGVLGGGFLLVGEVPNAQAEQAVKALDQAQTVDMNERVREWIREGWAPHHGSLPSPLSGLAGGTAKVRTYGHDGTAG